MKEKVELCVCVYVFVCVRERESVCVCVDVFLYLPLELLIQLTNLHQTDMNILPLQITVMLSFNQQNHIKLTNRDAESGVV